MGGGTNNRNKVAGWGNLWRKQTSTVPESDSLELKSELIEIISHALCDV